MLISLIVLNWNRSDLTLTALRSIAASTNVNFECIVVDNGSSQKELNKLKADIAKLSCSLEVRLIEIGINRYFGEGNNIGAEAARGDILVFLNNDVTVSPGWLEPLIERLLSDESIGAVGPKFLYPDGVLQEAGAFIDRRSGEAIQRGKFQKPEQTRFSLAGPVDYISAACMAIRKADFEAIRGFDFIFEPAYYEDTDVCFKLAGLGKSTWFEPSSTVVHVESATTSNPLNNLALSNIVEINRLKFLQRLNYGYYEKFVTSKPAKALKSKSKRAAVYTPYGLTTGGGERYILSVAEMLSKCGFCTLVITPHPYSKLRLNQLASEFDLELDGVSTISEEEAESLDFEIVVIMGNELYPKTRLRGDRTVFHCQFPFPSVPKQVASSSGLLEIDDVVVNSEFTKREYLKQLSATGMESKVKVINPPVVKVPLVTLNSRKTRIVSVGRFTPRGHPKNHHQMISAFSQLTKDHEGLELHLVGGLSSDKADREYFFELTDLARDLEVKLAPNLPPEALNELLRTASIYWHATGLGVSEAHEPHLCEHFGIAVVEAMSAGLIPLVVGSGGPRDIVEFGVTGFHYQTAASLARRTALVLGMPSSAVEEMRLAAIRSSARFSMERFVSEWRSLIGIDLSDNRHYQKIPYQLPIL
jgi:O-antigen biosynthesis protein